MQRVTVSVILALALLAIAGCGNPKSVGGAEERRLLKEAFKELDEWPADGDLARAERLLEEAREINPDNGWVLYNLGVVYEWTDRKPKAREYYVRVRDMNIRDRPAEVTDFKVELDFEKAEQKPLSEMAADNIERLDAGG